MAQEELKIRFRSYYALAVIILICFPINLSGQNNFIISGGIGYPEMIYGGVKYQFNQTQIGITLGTVPIFSYFSGSITGDFYYHFGGSSSLTEIHPWYGKIGLSYLKDEDYYGKDKYLYSNLRIGRDFNISSKAGIDIYTGLSFQLYHDRFTKVEQNEVYEDYENYVQFSLGISYYYKLR